MKMKQRVSNFAQAARFTLSLLLGLAVGTAVFAFTALVLFTPILVLGLTAAIAFCFKMYDLADIFANLHKYVPNSLRALTGKETYDEEIYKLNRNNRLTVLGFFPVIAAFETLALAFQAGVFVGSTASVLLRDFLNLVTKPIHSSFKTKATDDDVDLDDDEFKQNHGNFVANIHRHNHVARLGLGSETNTLRSGSSNERSSTMILSGSGNFSSADSTLRDELTKSSAPDLDSQTTAETQKRSCWSSLCRW